MGADGLPDETYIEVLSTPSLGITRVERTLAETPPPQLSTPSLGITVQKLRFLSDYHPDDFQLPLSGSLENYPTPRSWSRLNATFNSLSRDHVP